MNQADMDLVAAVEEHIAAKDMRIAELESAVNEQARLNGMGAEREARLMARVAELEKALRPFAEASMAGAEEMQAAATKVRGNPVDGTGAYVWQASRSLCVRNFLEAKRVLMVK